MSLPFADLRRYKQLGLSYTAVLVKLYLDEHGFTPVGLIADACGCSVRSVELAIAKLRSLELLSPRSPKEISHDHDHGDHGDKGTAKDFAVGSEADCAVPENVGDRQDDPLRDKLTSYEVLPWLVDQLLTKVDRQQLELQLEYHTHRLATGFKFKGHPARYLFSACLRNYAPPQDFFQRSYQARHGLTPDKPALIAPPPPPKPAEPMADEDRQATIATMLASPVPAVRRLGQRLAQDWGLEAEAVKPCAMA